MKKQYIVKQVHLDSYGSWQGLLYRSTFTNKKDALKDMRIITQSYNVKYGGVKTMVYYVNGFEVVTIK